MDIIKGGINVAPQFEAAGIEIAKPATAATAPTDDKATEATAATAEAQKPVAATETTAATHPDDVEGEDGLTPRQKREWTDAMRRTVGKKHRAQREAEELATSEYNRAQLAEERAAKLAQELEALRAGQSKQSEEPPKSADSADPGPGPEPQYKEGDDSNEYWAKWKEWNRKQAIWEFKAEMEKERQAQAAAEHEKALNERFDAVAAVVPDFKETLDNAQPLELGKVVGDHIMNSGMALEIVYYLAKNREHAERIRAMRTGEALVAIGELKGKLSPFAPANGTGKAKEPTSPSTPETESSKPAAGPSKRPAPVIAPIPTGTGMQADAAPSTQKEHVSAFGKREGVNLYARKRH